MSHVNEDTTATVRHIPLTPSHTCANTHKHTFGPWHYQQQKWGLSLRKFFVFFQGSFKILQHRKNEVRCQDGWGRGIHDRQGKHREGRYHNYTGHITLTGRDGTAQRRGAERESQRGRVRKQSSGHISMWWLCGCVSVLLPSNLWSICPGLFCIFVTMGCVNLHFALTRPVWCARISCSLCVNVCADDKGDRGSVFCRGSARQMTLSKSSVLLVPAGGSSLASLSGARYSRWCLPHTGVVRCCHRYTEENEGHRGDELFIRWMLQLSLMSPR